MPFELTATKLIYGGDALAYHAGRAVLVPRILPGERVEVEEVRTAKGVVHARPLRVLQAAPQRVDPPCPYFGRCGGCHYQHLSPQVQSTSKREILRETLRRIGSIDWKGEISLRAGPPWNYRNQAQIKVARQPGGQVELGFFESQSHRVYPIDNCLILSPRLNAVLGELRRPEWALGLGSLREIDLLADEHDEQVMITLQGAAAGAEGEQVGQNLLERIPGAVCVALVAKNQTRVLGQPTLHYAVGSIRYRVSPGSFFQVSRFLVLELVTSVTGEEQGQLALDLFAGVGLFSLPLARRFNRVVAAEANPIAASDLKANAEANGLSNLRVACETTYDFLRRFAQAEPDLVVMDPPRAGVDAGSLKLVTALRPRKIHYLSCSPPTLARDLSFLARHSYHLHSIELFDLFPQTYHVEALAKLARNP
ncbi:MAG TPA: 23S rRNA (uracil(1939)-C(5))-methyltransferase RlmD [Terriglobia bacterium]|nr:23S rRNA (uracil(1939)-C(5))-methyltransferase RlmD [Terriglobia bacterium]